MSNQLAQQHALWNVLPHGAPDVAFREKGGVGSTSEFLQQNVAPFLGLPGGTRRFKLPGGSNTNSGQVWSSTVIV